jgi:hypothetical protein
MPLYTFIHSLLNVLVQIANKMGLQKEGKKIISQSLITLYDRLCGLVVRVPGYRSRGPGWISGTTTFSEKY